MRYSSPTVILIAACALFVILGIFNAGIGPILAELADQTGSTLVAVGAIFTALFLGALIAQLASGFLTDRFGQRVVLIVAVFVMGAGIIGFTQMHSLVWFLVLAFVAGLGQGGLDLGANLLVAEAFPKNNLTALNVLHLFFGLGSSIGPAFISLSILKFNRGIYIIEGSAIFFLVLAGLFLFLKIKPHQTDQTPFENGKPVEPVKSIFLTPQLWLLSVLLLVAVGMEIGLGSWSTIYMQKTTRLSIETAALVTSGYWAFLTVGRLLSAFLSRRLTREKMMLLNLGGAVIGGIVFALSNGALVPSIISMLFVSMCFGGMYPLVISVTSAAFPGRTGKATGIVVAAGSVGGLALPWLAGLILNRVDAVAFAWFIAGFIGVMFMIQFFLRRHQRSTAVADASAES